MHIEISVCMYMLIHNPRPESLIFGLLVGLFISNPNWVCPNKIFFSIIIYEKIWIYLNILQKKFHLLCKLCYALGTLAVKEQSAKSMANYQINLQKYLYCDVYFFKQSICFVIDDIHNRLLPSKACQLVLQKYISKVFF